MAMSLLVGAVVLVIVFAAAVLPAALFWRCRKVDAIRSQKLRRSYEDAKTDMDSGLSWEWRFDAYQAGPSFTEMVWKMWRPVSSFYQDQRPAVHRNSTP
jgi:hypothetical protein